MKERNKNHTLKYSIPATEIVLTKTRDRKKKQQQQHDTKEDSFKSNTMLLKRTQIQKCERAYVVSNAAFTCGNFAFTQLTLVAST